MPPIIRRLAALLGLSLAAALCAPAMAAETWHRAESANFVIYTDVDAAAARRLGERLEAFDQVLRIYHGIPVGEPVRRKLPIYLIQRRADLQRIRPGADSGARGFYTSHLEDTYAVAVADDEDSHLLHEYVHHFMLDRYPFGYAGWLVEGYPEYFMTFRETREDVEIGLPHENRARWLVHGRWIPFETLLGTRPSDLRTDNDRAMFYAQAWGLTHWMLSDPARKRQLDAYVRAVGGGEDSVKAMTRVTGMKPDQISRAVRKYLERGFPAMRLSQKALQPVAIAVQPLPPAAADVLLPTLRIKNDNGIDAPEDRTDGPVLLAAVVKAAARHRGERLADLALARAELKVGDLAKAEALLQARIAADPKDVEALQLVAAARLKAARSAPPEQAAKLLREAQGYAGRAHKLNPDHYPTLLTYAQAREGADSYPTENDLNVLLDALDLAPQVGVLRMKAAEALARRGRNADAVAVLRPLAFNPHAGPAAESARTLLTTLQARPDGPSTPGAASASTPAAAP